MRYAPTEMGTNAETEAPQEKFLGGPYSHVVMQGGRAPYCRIPPECLKTSQDQGMVAAVRFFP